MLTGSHNAPSAGKSGFTLIEIIAVLLLLGIIGAVVFSRSLNTNADLLGEIEIIKGHLRYAQLKAMNDLTPWGLNFAGSTYTLEENNTPSATPLPAQDSSTYNLTAGSATASTNPVIFDEWGDPGTGPITVTVTVGGDSATFSIAKTTGFIP